MLTAELVKPRIRMLGSQLSIDLLKIDDAIWLQTAADLIALLREQQGQSLAAWERALEKYEGERIDYIVVRGMAKVLTDAATFTPLATPIAPVQLRERLFAYGPVFSTTQLFQQQVRSEVMQTLASELEIPYEQLEAALFADRPIAALLTDIGPELDARGINRALQPGTGEGCTILGQPCTYRSAWRV